MSEDKTRSQHPNESLTQTEGGKAVYAGQGPNVGRSDRHADDTGRDAMQNALGHGSGNASGGTGRYSTEKGHRSFAAIGGHPLHPMIVPLPIGAFVLLLLSDIAYLATGNLFWANASYGLLIVGVLAGLLAGLVGALDYFSIDKARVRTGQVHAYGNVAVLLLAAVNWLLRLDDPAGPIAGGGIALTIATIVLLGVTGWAGGELSYRHRIGVIPDEEEEAAVRRSRQQGQAQGETRHSPAE